MATASHSHLIEYILLQLNYYGRTPHRIQYNNCINTHIMSSQLINVNITWLMRAVRTARFFVHVVSFSLDLAISERVRDKRTPRACRHNNNRNKGMCSEHTLTYIRNVDNRTMSTFPLANLWALGVPKLQPACRCTGKTVANVGNK